MNTRQDIEPIRRELEKMYEAVGICSLESDVESIKSMTNELIDESAIHVVAKWEALPDLVGQVKIQKPLPVREEKTVIVRIVEDEPVLKDIYTLKRYSEVLSPNYSFLITKKPFDNQTREYLEKHSHILRFLRRASGSLSAAVPIVLMTWDDTEKLVIDDDVVSKNPFDSKHLWT